LEDITMVVSFRPFVFTDQGPDKDNPGTPPNPSDEEMDVDGQAPARSVKILARTLAKEPIEGKDWRIVCILNLAHGLIQNGATVTNADGSKKLRTKEELAGLDDPTDDFFKYNVVKCRRTGDHLSVIFQVELTTSWRAFATNEGVRTAIGFYSWKLYDTEFEDPNIVPIGFLKDRAHDRLQHSPTYQTERLKRLINESVGNDIAFEFSHRPVITHKSPNPNGEGPTNPPIEVIGAWEVYVEKVHRKTLEEKLKGPLIYYQTANDDLATYEQQLQDHVSTVTNLSYYSVKGIEPHVLDSMTRGQTTTTIRNLALQHRTNGKPTLLAIEDTRHNSEVHFITTKETRDVAEAFVNNELKAHYQDSTELADEERDAVTFTAVRAATQKAIPRVIIAQSTRDLLSTDEWPAMETKRRSKGPPTQQSHNISPARATVTGSRSSRAGRGGGGYSGRSSGYAGRTIDGRTPAVSGRGRVPPNAWANRSVGETATQNTMGTANSSASEIENLTKRMEGMETMMKEFMQQTQAGIQAAIQASIQTALQSTVQAAIASTSEAATRERDQMKREQTEFMQRMEHMIEESIPPARASEEPTPMAVDDSVPAALKVITEGSKPSKRRTRR
jgi:hypothetical protein